MCGLFLRFSRLVFARICFNIYSPEIWPLFLRFFTFYLHAIVSINNNILFAGKKIRRDSRYRHQGHVVTHCTHPNPKTGPPTSNESLPAARTIIKISLIEHTSEL